MNNFLFMEVLESRPSLAWLIFPVYSPRVIIFPASMFYGCVCLLNHLQMYLCNKFIEKP